MPDAWEGRIRMPTTLQQWLIPGLPEGLNSMTKLLGGTESEIATILDHAKTTQIHQQRR